MTVKQMHMICCIYAVAIFSCWLSPAEAASTLMLAPSGPGSYTLTGTGIEGAASFDILIGYDTATLANPRVNMGPLVSGSLSAVNPNVPGTVRIAIIRSTPITGSGVIATVGFDLRGSGPGKVTSMSARLMNINGTQITALVQSSNLPETSPPANSASSGPVQGGSTENPSSGTTIVGVPVLVVPGPQAGADSPQDGGGAARDGEGPVSGSDKMTAKIEEKKDGSGSPPPSMKTDERPIYSPPSVLDRFKDYKGERTAKSLIALFDENGAVGCRQKPAVAIADGKTALTFTFISEPGEIASSDMAVMGARLKSLKRDPDNTNTWIAELVPERGALRASVAVSRRAMKMIYPLTIVPDVALPGRKKGALSEKDLAQYLTRRGTAKKPLYDLNNDGKRDYIDDFILTATYLAGKV